MLYESRVSCYVRCAASLPAVLVSYRTRNVFLDRCSGDKGGGVVVDRLRNQASMVDLETLPSFNVNIMDWERSPSYRFKDFLVVRQNVAD